MVRVRGTLSLIHLDAKDFLSGIGALSVRESRRRNKTVRLRCVWSNLDLTPGSMRLIYFDIDTLRPDHLGCYGYSRATSPNIDEIASGGIRFDRVYASDSPCLPSRSALVTGRFGVNNGVVNHGGRRSELFAARPDRRRQSDWALTSWPALLRQCGIWCTSISTFAERHSAYHWYAGFNETYNRGSHGRETADDVTPIAIDWLRRRGAEDNWFLHIHLWDPHTPYRTPESYGNPFESDPVPAWIDDEILERHWSLAGPHSAQEVMGFDLDRGSMDLPRQPQQMRTADDVRTMFDGYDVGIRYADEHVGGVMSVLGDLGVIDDTAILVSSDHGETLGELGIYCDHQTADEYTHRLPLILRWPGLEGGKVDSGFRYQVDAAATIVELLGGSVPDSWDGVGFSSDLYGRSDTGRGHLVLSCAAWATQRSVRFGRWLYVRTYHDAFHGFPDVMLFDLQTDPHEQQDVASENPQVVNQAASYLVDWESQNMRRSQSGFDPIWTVIAEGGGFYTRDRVGPYLERLETTGRSDWAKRIASTHLGDS